MPRDFAPRCVGRLFARQALVFDFDFTSSIEHVFEVNNLDRMTRFRRHAHQGNAFHRARSRKVITERLGVERRAHEDDS